MKRPMGALCGAVLVAASVVPAEAQRENSLEAGAWALQFSVEGEFIAVSSFDGGLALKRHFSPRSALRMSVAANVNGTDHESSNGISQSIEFDGVGVGVSVLYQRYVDPDADANLYWGVGPSVGWGNESQESVRADSLVFLSEFDSWSVGIDAVLGVEWFAARVISFHAEYIGSARFTRRKDSNEAKNGTTIDMQERTIDSWSIAEGGAVRFGLSVYF